MADFNSFLNIYILGLAICHTNQGVLVGHKRALYYRTQKRKVVHYIRM